MGATRGTFGWESMRPVPGRSTVIADASGRSLRGNSNREMKVVVAHDASADPEHRWTAYIEYGDCISTRVTGPTQVSLERRMREFSESILRTWTSSVTRPA